jgi:hypothetical protein
MDLLPAPPPTNIALSNGRSIGGCPEDEYDGYVRKIAAMHRDNASDEETARISEMAEVENMGRGPASRFDRGRAMKVIAALRAVAAPP